MLRTNTVIGTNAWSYCQVSLDSLGIKNQIWEYGSPRIESDIHAGISVSVNQHSTPANKGLAFVYTMPDVPTTGTSFAGIPWVYFDNFQPILCRYTFECHSEGIVGHSLVPTVALMGEVTVFQSLQIFNRNRTVMFSCEINNLMCNLVVPSFVEVRFLGSEFSEQSNCSVTASVSIGFEFTSANTDVTLFIPQVSSKIELLGNSMFFWVVYANGSQRSRTDIYAKDVLSMLGNEVSFEIHCNLPGTVLFAHSEVCGTIAFLKHTHVSLICTILCNWNTEPTIQRSNRNHWIAILSGSELTTSGNVETNWYVVNSIPIVLETGNDVPNQVNYQLGLQIELFLDSIINPGLNIVPCKLIGVIRDFIPELTYLEDNLGCSGICSDKFREFGILPVGQLEDVEFQSPNNFCHIPVRNMGVEVYKSSGEIRESIGSPPRHRMTGHPNRCGFFQNLEGVR